MVPLVNCDYRHLTYKNNELKISLFWNEILSLWNMQNTDNSYPMVEAKKGLMEEVLTLNKIMDAVWPLIVRPKNGTSIMEMSSLDQLAVTAPEYKDTEEE